MNIIIGTLHMYVSLWVNIHRVYERTVWPYTISFLVGEPRIYVLPGVLPRCWHISGHRIQNTCELSWMEPLCVYANLVKHRYMYIVACICRNWIKQFYCRLCCAVSSLTFATSSHHHCMFWLCSSYTHPCFVFFILLYFSRNLQ